MITSLPQVWECPCMWSNTGNHYFCLPNWIGLWYHY